MSIPKIIHYCWFGGNSLPEDAKRCIDSWKKYLPDYEIREWSEENFDLNYCNYVKEAYESKKWAFVSDVARLYAIVSYGGIYMDTDVEVRASLDEFLELKAFSGFEEVSSVPTGIMACEANHPFFKELLYEYNDRNFINKDGSFDLTTNVTSITNKCVEKGLKLNGKKQTIEDFTLYPMEYFCPLSHKTGELYITDNTKTIHWFSGSWKSKEEKEIHQRAIEIRKKNKIFGSYFSFIYEKGAKSMYVLRNGGFVGFYNRIKNYLKNKRK